MENTRDAAALEMIDREDHVRKRILSVEGNVDAADERWPENTCAEWARCTHLYISLSLSLSLPLSLFLSLRSGGQLSIRGMVFSE